MLATLGVLLVALSGCLESSTDVTGVQASTTDDLVPTMDVIRTKVSMSDAQAAELQKNWNGWNRTERNRAAGSAAPLVSPALEFVASSAEILERPQLTTLVGVVAQHQRARRMDGDQARMGKRQGRHGPRDGRRGPGGGFGIFEDLDLRQDQKDAIAAARKEMHDTLAPLREQLQNGELTRDEFHAAAIPARDAFRAAVEEILDADQRALIEEKKKERFVERLERRVESHDAKSARRLELLTKILQLDDAQVLAIAAIQKDAGAELATILASVKDGSQTPTDARTALEALRASTHEAVVAELSTEQAELLEQLQQLRPGRGRHRPRS